MDTSMIQPVEVLLPSVLRRQIETPPGNVPRFGEALDRALNPQTDPQFQPYLMDLTEVSLRYLEQAASSDITIGYTATLIDAYRSAGRSTIGRIVSLTA